jgi:hypothetical protein
MADALDTLIFQWRTLPSGATRYFHASIAAKGSLFWSPASVDICVWTRLPDGTREKDETRTRRIETKSCAVLTALEIAQAECDRWIRELDTQ